MIGVDTADVTYPHRFLDKSEVLATASLGRNIDEYGLTGDGIVMLQVIRDMFRPR
jgi:hypothetical protein